MKARLIGVLFLLAFALYGSGVDVLMLLNSVDVIAIGVLAFPVLRRTHKLGAYAYLASRILEGVLLAVGVLTNSEVVYWVAMIGLALGSLFFCRVLLQARLVPRPLAVLGLIGYAALAAGGILELLGYSAGLVLSIPGGLFEVVLGILLVVKGFSSGEGARAVAGAGEVDGRTAVG